MTKPNGWTGGSWRWECQEMGGIYRDGVWNLVDQDGRVVLKGVKGVELVKNDKYTKLVRAAPSLYEALAELVEWVGNDAYTAKARTALSDAKGERDGCE